MEHYSDLYSRLVTVYPEALDIVIDHLSSDESPGADYISSDFIKACKSALLLPLHEIICQCWKNGDVPQEMRDRQK